MLFDCSHARTAAPAPVFTAPRHGVFIAGLIAVLLSVLTPQAHALKSFAPTASTSEPVFLTADQAFQLSTRSTDTELQLTFRITPGYYLYLDKFHFTLISPPASATSLTLGAPVFSQQASTKDDANFGVVRVFHRSVTVTLPLTRQGSAANTVNAADAVNTAKPAPARLKVSWQGCADAGLCYPPQQKIIALAAAPAPRTENPAVAANTPRLESLTAGMAAETRAETSLAAAPTSYLTQLLLMFALGLGLAFTPCVLPMLPILAGIVARQHTSSALRGFVLALSYVLGVAAVYALMGFAVGLLGAQINLPSWFQQPVVLGLFAGLFFALALSLLGVFELRLPSALHNYFDGLSRQQKSGALIGTFLIGVFSALVVSPCVSAPLFGVLLHISRTGDAAFGALSLFLMALGMGVPLLILGATEGRLLPKAGAWMDDIKKLFGFALMLVAADLLSRLLPAPLSLALYALCAAAVAAWLWQMRHAPLGVFFLLRGAAFCAFIYAAALMVGALSGGSNPLQPLSALAVTGTPAGKEVAFTRIRNNAELDAAVQAATRQGRAVMLDFYADWCTSCKTMEREVFADARIAPRLQKLRLLRADITANSADDRALLARFTLFGPPALVFINAQGREIAAARVVGSTSASAFLTHLNQHGL